MKFKKDIFAFILAREGSKRLKNKNILSLGTKPLIQWTIDSAKKSKYIKTILCSTDSKKIIKICKDNKINYIERKKNLAKDNTASESVILDILNYLKENFDSKPHSFILLQPTSPFRNSNHIDKAIKIYLNNNLDNLYGVKEVKKEIFNIQSKKMYLSKKKSVMINGAIYIVNTAKFLKFKRIVLPNKNNYFLMNDLSSIDIDTVDDLRLAKSNLKKFF